MELITVRDAVYDFMRQCGANKWFGNPGSTELPMLKHFPDDFEYVLGLQEATVVGMADGYAQITGRAAFVNLHSAAGIGNAMGNIYTAFKNQTPMVIVAGQQSRGIQQFDAYLNSKQASELPKPYVKWSIEPARAQDVPAAIARAYYTAMQVPRGPVLVSVPADDWDELASQVHLRELCSAVKPDLSAVQALAARLREAHRPALIVGAAIDRDDAWEQAVAVAERLGAAVFVAPLSCRCSFPEDHPNFQGFLPGVRDQICQRLEGYDQILIVGAPAFTYHVDGDGPHIPPTSQLSMLTDDAEIATWAPVGDALICGIKGGLVSLLEQLEKTSAIAVRKRADPSAVDDATMSAALVMKSLAKVRLPNDIFVEEAPTTRVVIHEHLPMLKPRSFFTMASGGLGFGMPAATGIAMGSPATRVINIVGDGSAMYSPQAIWTAVQHHLNVKFLIINNGRYAALKRFAGVLKFPADSKLVGTELPGLDFVSLAKSYGCPAIRIETTGELERELKAAIDGDGPMLLEIVVP